MFGRRLIRPHNHIDQSACLIADHFICDLVQSDRNILNGIDTFEIRGGPQRCSFNKNIHAYKHFSGFAVRDLTPDFTGYIPEQNAGACQQ